jgi:hypothetical protein
MKIAAVCLRAIGVIVVCIMLATVVSAADSVPQKPTLLKPCSQCHAPADHVLRGTLGNVSNRAEAFAVNTGIIWTVKYDDDTKVKGWGQDITKMPKEKEIAVHYVERDGQLYAKEISVKQPAVIPPEKLVSTSQMIDYVRKGNAFIVDSRPAARFYEGAIPGAINIFDAEFDKYVHKLPADKNQLIIFYCAGPT